MCQVTLWGGDAGQGYLDYPPVCFSWVFAIDPKFPVPKILEDFEPEGLFPSLTSSDALAGTVWVLCSSPCSQ